MSDTHNTTQSWKKYALMFGGIALATLAVFIGVTGQWLQGNLQLLQTNTTLQNFQLSPNIQSVVGNKVSLTLASANITSLADSAIIDQISGEIWFQKDIYPTKVSIIARPGAKSLLGSIDNIALVDAGPSTNRTKKISISFYDLNLTKNSIPNDFFELKLEYAAEVQAQTLSFKNFMVLDKSIATNFPMTSEDVKILDSTTFATGYPKVLPPSGSTGKIALKATIPGKFHWIVIEQAAREPQPTSADIFTGVVPPATTSVAANRKGTQIVAANTVNTEIIIDIASLESTKKYQAYYVFANDQGQYILNGYIGELNSGTITPPVTVTPDTYLGAVRPGSIIPGTTNTATVTQKVDRASTLYYVIYDTNQDNAGLTADAIKTPASTIAANRKGSLVYTSTELSKNVIFEGLTSGQTYHIYFAAYDGATYLTHGKWFVFTYQPNTLMAASPAPTYTLLPNGAADVAFTPNKAVTGVYYALTESTLPAPDFATVRASNNKFDTVANTLKTLNLTALQNGKSYTLRYYVFDATGNPIEYNTLLTFNYMYGTASFYSGYPQYRLGTGGKATVIYRAPSRMKVTTIVYDTTDPAPTAAQIKAAVSGTGNVVKATLDTQAIIENPQEITGLTAPKTYHVYYLAETLDGASIIGSGKLFSFPYTTDTYLDTTKTSVEILDNNQAKVTLRTTKTGTSLQYLVTEVLTTFTDSAAFETAHTAAAANRKSAAALAMTANTDNTFTLSGLEVGKTYYVYYLAKNTSNGIEGLGLLTAFTYGSGARYTAIIDPTRDGYYTGADALEILYIINGKTSSATLANADFDGAGVIDLVDVLQVLKYTVCKNSSQIYTKYGAQYSEPGRCSAWTN